MKATVISIMTITLSLAVSLASADDMWSETPDLDQLSATSPAFVEPATISNRIPTIDLWAETPDFSETGKPLDFQPEKVVILKQIAAPELYAETPDLNSIATTPKTEGDKNLAQR